MLGYLSKFVLQMLPTISATVIGAYIVTTWINPKTPPERAKVAASAQGQETAKASPAAEPPVAEAVTPPAEAKSTETAKPVKAATGPDNIRIIPIVKEKAPAIDAPVAAPAPAGESEAAIEERKGANELARAAIQRLRGAAEPARPADEGTKPAAPPLHVQQAGTAPEPVQPAPAATVTSAPPLPPAVSIAAPRYPQDEGADQLALGQSEDRVAPPAEIPAARNPFSLQASHRVAENPSFADDFVSATRSFFRAITPQ